MGGKCDLTDFDGAMIVGARQGGLSIAENGAKKKEKKHPVSSCSVGKNTLLMRMTSGEWPDWSKLRGKCQWTG